MTTMHRYLEKFTSYDGSITVTFGLLAYEYSATQGIRAPYKQVAGANYAYPLRGNVVGLKDVAQESARFTYADIGTTLDTEYEALRLAVYTAALGWLYTLGADGSRRRARAQITAMPDYGITQEGGLSIPTQIAWNRFSDWQSPTVTSWGPVTINAGSVAFTINAGGDADVYDAVFLLKGTFTAPQIINNDNSYVFGSNRAGSAGTHWLRVDAGRNRVEFSSNSGVTYAPDFTNYVRLPGQIQLMKLHSGVNNMHYAQPSGTPSATLEGTLYPHWI